MSHHPITNLDIYNAITEFREEMQTTYVSKEEFGPVKSIVYGAVGLALTGIAIAILAQVVKATM